MLTESKAKNKQKKQEDPSFNETGFTSTVIVPDECSVPSNYNSKQGKFDDETISVGVCLYTAYKLDDGNHILH